MKLDVFAQDDRGDRFSSNVGVPLELHANNLEVATFSLDEGQDQISVLALKAGHVGLHVSLSGSPTTDDLIKINVTQIISPLNPVVHLGGRITFRSHLRGDYHEARWSSDTPLLTFTNSTAIAKVGVCVYE